MWLEFPGGDKQYEIDVYYLYDWIDTCKWHTLF